MGRNEDALLGRVCAGGNSGHATRTFKTGGPQSQNKHSLTQLRWCNEIGKSCGTPASQQRFDNAKIVWSSVGSFHRCSHGPSTHRPSTPGPTDRDYWWLLWFCSSVISRSGSPSSVFSCRLWAMHYDGWTVGGQREMEMLNDVMMVNNG